MSVEDEKENNENKLIEKIDFILATYYLSSGSNDYLDNKNKGKFLNFCQSNNLSDQDLFSSFNNKFIDETNNFKFIWDSNIPKPSGQSSSNNTEIAIYLLKYIYTKNESPLPLRTMQTEFINPSTRNIIITQNYMVKAFNSIQSKLDKLDNKIDEMFNKIDKIPKKGGKRVEACDFCGFPDMPPDGKEIGCEGCNVKQYCSSSCRESDKSHRQNCKI